VITGNEVYSGTIKDGFSPVLHEKVEAFGCTVNNQAFVPDNSDIIARTILEFRASGSEVILCCSGMSVDPDDVTPLGIRMSGATIAFYGLPVMPGAMFMYGKLNETHILGVPACVLHAPATAFDLLFPRVLAGEELTFADTRLLGHGGLCLGCKTCNFPVCPLGK
jgi:molybdopterin biosynthesis enzyme